MSEIGFFSIDNVFAAHFKTFGTISCRNCFSGKIVNSVVDGFQRVKVIMMLLEESQISY